MKPSYLNSIYETGTIPLSTYNRQQLNQQRKRDIFHVLWIGQEGSTVFSKDFLEYNQAKEFAKPLKESVILKLNQANKFGKKFDMAETPQSKEFLKAVYLRRKLQNKKGKFSSVDGETTISTTSEYQKSQKIRLVDVFVIAPVLVYASTRKDIPTWLRVSLGVIGAATAYYNAKNYLINKKADKVVDGEAKK